MEPRAVIFAVTVVSAATIIGFWSAPATEPPLLITTKQSCQPDSLSEQVAAADLIIVGQVLVVFPSRTTGLAEVYVHPTEVYKGTTKNNTVILMAQAATDIPRSSKQLATDLHFTSDDPSYLLFLKKRHDGRFNTSTCYGSRVLGEGLTEEEKTLLRVPE
jgi:hypothetical protein